MVHQITTLSQDEDFNVCLKCEEVKTRTGPEQLSLKSVSVWINKPHVVNRRLCGSKMVAIFRVQTKEEAYALVEEYKDYYITKNKTRLDKENTFHFTDLVNESAAFTVIIRELIPKSEFFPKLLEAVVYDKQEVTLSFRPIDQDCTGETEDLRPTTELSYQLKLKHGGEYLSEKAETNEIKLTWSCDHEGIEQPRRQITSQWLRSILLDKLINWSQVKNICTSVTSLQLVPVDKYKDTYIRLKNTYGRELVKNWTERTDPKKFVYEDVAIAAYLLLVWEEDRMKKNLSRKQSFVDLGCGNGLLVYILTKEGHKGHGIDLRRRKIWDSFGPDIDLKEEAVRPSADHLYPEYDWIIGNHSDELTPWIPVIAARSSYTTSFFLLPCCPYDFDRKFDGATEKGKSRYGSYLDYVKDITINCGFVPESDTLRIPSTKRICVIGRRRSYEQKNEHTADEFRQAFIDKKTVHMNERLRKVNIQSSKMEVNDAATFSESGHCTDGSIIQHTKENSSGNCTSFCSDLDEFASVISTAVSQEIPCSPTVDGCKRKCDNLGSADSGFYEPDVEDIDEHSATKRHKISCSRQGSDELDASDVKIIETDDKSPTIVKAHQWVEDFQPRVEPGVRNCQKVPEQVKFRIVQAVFGLVLAAHDSRNVLLASGKTWTKGGIVSLSEVAALFDKSVLQELKSEFGGLQTLLRNHSHIFQVTGGSVQLRDFTASDPWIGRNIKKAQNKRSSPQDTRKTTLCWFDANHPDGCPRTKEDCQFAHGIVELRKKLSKEKRV